MIVPQNGVAPCGKGGKDINNPKIPLSRVVEAGTLLWGDTPPNDTLRRRQATGAQLVDRPACAHGGWRSRKRRRVEAVKPRGRQRPVTGTLSLSGPVKRVAHDAKGSAPAVHRHHPRPVP